MNLINIFPDPSKLIDIENTNKIVLFIFLKITDISIKKNIKNDFFKENINILHWFDCQYTNIGKEDFWSDALIIKFKNKNISKWRRRYCLLGTCLGFNKLFNAMGYWFALG